MMGAAEFGSKMMKKTWKEKNRTKPNKTEQNQCKTEQNRKILEILVKAPAHQPPSHQPPLDIL